MSQFTDGYLVARAVGERALIGVLGDAGMDVQRLHAEAQESAARTSILLTAESSKGEVN
ncbi:MULTISPECIES: hypothetical protein [Kitasatospora]|uniref:Uncharacterized protein n=1 Tax=Kitasatospora cystarginea TaxID=58350 RepID=A0ABP5RSA5_9ACTN